MQKKKLNLGCGTQTPSNWVNVDYSLGAKLNQYPFFPVINSKLKIFNHNWNSNILLHDLRTKFPWQDNSVDIIYSSHTLEHFDKSDGKYFLQECYRVIKQNGIVRIIVPDLNSIILKYINGELLAEDFVDALGVSIKLSKSSFFKKIIGLFVSFPHLCMYDSESLIRIMSDIGFDCCQREAFDSEIEDIQIIELENRVNDSIIIEARK